MRSSSWSWRIGLLAVFLGLFLMQLDASIVITSGLSERVVRMIGERVTAAAALVAHAVTLAAWLALGAHPRFVMLLPVLVMHGICNGLEMAPLVALGVAALPARDRGLAAGVVNTSRQVGAALGTALLGSISGAGGWDDYRTAMIVAIVAYVAGGFVIRSTRRAPVPLPVSQTGGADD